MGNYQGKATGNHTWGETPNGTTYVAVDVNLFDDKGQNAGTITHKFFFSAKSQENVRISIEGLKLLGARIMNNDVTDLYGLGSTTAGIVTQTTQYGEEIRYINPPGPRARGVKDEEKLSADKLAAFRARMMPLVAGITASSGAAPANTQQSVARPPQPRGAQAPTGAAPWDRQPAAQPATASQQAQNPAADVEPWNEPDAYDGLEQPAQAPQQAYQPQQAAAGGATRRAPF